MKPHAGLLHTAPALAPEFDTRLHDAIPDARVTHLVDASLLAQAIATGVDDALTARVVADCRALADLGCDAILVTCSSIGEATECAGRKLALPVLRVDQRMAAEAARLVLLPGAKGRIAVIATLESTLEPSVQLVKRALGPDEGVTVEPVLCTGAAEARGRGDDREHDRIIRSRVQTLDPVDVVILAQASMSSAAVDAAVDVPILSSPEGAVWALADALGSRARVDAGE